MSRRSTLHELIDGEEVRQVLAESFYRGPVGEHRTTDSGDEAESASKTKPEHYKVVCISLYTEDLMRLDEKVRQLKKRGHRKMNRSALIRFALDHVDLEALPRAY